MTFNDYQRLAVRTASDTTGVTVCALGLAGEGGEVADIVKKAIAQGHDRDDDRILEELGDILWYVALMADNLGVEMDWVAERNVFKLSQRYPTGFDPERSKNR